MPARVLVADDSVVFRRVLSEALSTLPDIEVVGSAPNGKLALQRIRELKPDIVTLDMEMPEMDGLTVLEALRQEGLDTLVIVVSALTQRGGNLTMKALEKGAVDFITKPDTASAEESRAAILKELAPRIRILARRREIRKILKDGPGRSAAQPVQPERAQRGDAAAEAIQKKAPVGVYKKPEMILIGVSTGGPNALARILPEIPASIGAPLFIVQHMPPVFTRSLADSLSAKCALRVVEASHLERAEPNTVYIAPGGKQMRISTATDGRPLIEITDDPPENNCKPAVDYLFRSAALRFPGRSMAVILTGMGSDGALGLRLLKRHGCHVIAQDEATSVVFGMPKAAIDAGVVDVVLPVEAIASRIVASMKGCFA